MKPLIESVAKTIYQPHESLALKLKVLLGKKDRNGARRKMYSNYDYKSHKYGTEDILRSVYISTTDYVVVESVLSYEMRMQNIGVKPYSVWFSYGSLWLLKKLLKTALEWVSQDKLFRLDEAGGVAGMKSTAYNRSYVVKSPEMQRFSEHILKITPTLKIIPDTQKKERAVNVIMGESNIQVCSLNEAELEGFYDTIANFDLCANAQALVTQAQLLSVKEN